MILDKIFDIFHSLLTTLGNFTEELTKPRNFNLGVLGIAADASILDLVIIYLGTFIGLVITFKIVRLFVGG